MHPEGWMQQIYPKITAAEVIIFGTPVYYYGPTGQMKLLLDRMRPYGADGRLKGKKGFIVAPSAEGARCCGALIKMFRMSFDYLGIEFTGKVLGTAYEKGEIEQDKRALRKAYALGMSLK